MALKVVTLADSPPRIGYRAGELAALTGFTERHLRRLIADGTLPTIRIGRSVFVTAEAVVSMFGGDPR